MALPTLPTDNLYKFYFIAGITIMITAFIMFFEKWDSFIEKSDALKLETTKRSSESNARFDLATEKSNQLAEEIKLLSKRLSSTPVENLPKNPFEDVEAKLAEVRTSLDEPKIQHKVNRAMSNQEIEILLSHSKSLKFIILGWSLFFIFGMFLTRYGHKKWYEEIQIPANEKSKVELELLQLELAKKKSESINNQTTES